ESKRTSRYLEVVEDGAGWWRLVEDGRGFPPPTSTILHHPPPAFFRAPPASVSRAPAARPLRLPRPRGRAVREDERSRCAAPRPGPPGCGARSSDSPGPARRPASATPST